MIKQISFLLTVIIITGCEESSLDFDESCETNPSFSDCVQPVFDFYCTSSCHNTGSPSSGLILISGMSYNQLYNIDSEYNSNYKRVIPYEPENSLLYISMSDAGNDVNLQMPLNGQTVPSEQIEYIRKWIEQGAMNN